MLSKMDQVWTPDYVEFIMEAPFSLDPKHRWLMNKKWDIHVTFLNFKFRAQEQEFIARKEEKQRTDILKEFAKIRADNPQLFGPQAFPMIEEQT